jgi:hypothetical protein
LNYNETPISERLDSFGASKSGPAAPAPPPPLFRKLSSKPNPANTNTVVNSNEGGLSLTCSMTDFSLKFYNRLAIRSNMESRFYYSENMNFTEDKDSLSVRVAYIKVSISRFRRVHTTNNMLTSHESSSAMEDITHANDVKLSILADVGNSSFVYDMRNIKEVFVFPKIWYRRSLARRVFLGEDSTAAAAAAAAAAASTSNMNNKSHQSANGGGSPNLNASGRSMKPKSNPPGQSEHLSNGNGAASAPVHRSMNNSRENNGNRTTSGSEVDDDDTNVAGLNGNKSNGLNGADIMRRKLKLEKFCVFGNFDIFRV